MKNILGIVSLIIAVIGLLLFVFLYFNISSFIDGPPAILWILIILCPVLGLSLAIISLFTEKNIIYPIIAIVLLLPVFYFWYGISKINF